MPNACVSGSGVPKQQRKAEQVVKEVMSMASPDLRYTQLKRVSMSRLTLAPYIVCVRVCVCV